MNFANFKAIAFFGILAVAAFAFVAPAEAATPSCLYGAAYGDGTGWVQNDCSETFTVGIASYKKVDNTIGNQVLFDSKVVSIAPGARIGRSTLSVGLPSCAAQIDVFKGYPLVPPFYNGDNLIDAKDVAGSFCTPNVPPPPPPPPPSPRVIADIKADGQDGPITIPHGTAATISWTSQGASSCAVTPGNQSGLSGSFSTGTLILGRVYTVNCTGPGGQANDEVLVNVNRIERVIADIKADGRDGPITIPYATAATITWTSQNAISCTVFPGGYTAPNNTTGQSTGPLTGTVTYTISCSNQNISNFDSVTVNVQNQSIPPTVTISANPATINQGQSSLLNWQSQNANLCYASVGWGGPKSLAGFESVWPTSTTIYTITCTNSTNQPATSQTIVTVIPNQTLQPTLTLTANPTSITQGQSSLLNWYGTNVSTCTASGGWSNYKNISGSETVYPSITTTYYLNCTGSYGPVSAQATVFVNTQQNLPTVTLNANPTYINQGQSSLLSWYSANATNCTASGGWSGWKNISGSETVYPPITTTYTITCSNNYGVAYDVKTVVVSGSNLGTGNATVTKLVRNTTLNQTNFSNSVDAQGLDTLEFEIRVRNNDSTSISSMTVRDILPQELFYISGSTTVGGQTAADGITQSGLTLYSLNPFEERVIRFRAVVFYGTAAGRTITNQATATGPSGTIQNGFATVNIRNRGQVLGIGDIVTGPENPVPWVLAIGLLGSLAFHFFMVRRGKFAPVSPSAAPMRVAFVSVYESKESIAAKEAKPRHNSVLKELENKLLEIRAREARPDTESFS